MGVLITRTSVVAGSAPTNSVAPAITGTPTEGEVLTCSTGTWSNSPSSYSYNWRADGVTLSAADQNTYTPDAGDVGVDIDCVVTATNAFGSGNATSNEVGPIEAAEEPGDAMILDDFEGSAVRIVQPNSVDGAKWMWNMASGDSDADISFSTAQKRFGSKSLLMDSNITGNLQIHCYTYTETKGSGWGDGWKYLRRFVNNEAMASPSAGDPAWTLGQYNRLRFWVKLPSGYDNPTSTISTYEGHNIEFGTYLTENEPDEQYGEDNNNHYYHYLTLATRGGVWQQVIIDTHTDHQRGNGGNTENADFVGAYFEGGTRTYFDLMTRFYFDIVSDGVTGEHYFDHFEFYQETETENTNQIRSLHGCYEPVSNRVSIGWHRKKQECESGTGAVNHEVKYAFSSIHAMGWASATAAPSGTVVPGTEQGYNGMAYTTTSIDVTGQSVIYMGIKPANNSGFREIAIPLDL